jgi:uncharacterized protein YceH (UPF0502 family)
MGLAALIIGSLSGPAAAQTTITTTDIQRLQDSVYLAERDVSQVRTRDSARASQMQAEVDELRDEVIYLKVKLRKERSLARSEYADVRDRIEDIRSRARGDATGAYSVAPDAPGRAPGSRANAGTRANNGTNANTNSARSIEIPAGTELDVRLQHNLNSGTVVVEDRFEATTISDLVADGRTAIPAGSMMRGVVTAVEPATRTNRTARMTVSFDQITVNGRALPVRGTVTEAIEGNAIKGEAGRTAAGAGVGAIIGGILGGTKGAIAGLIIGGGGTIAATEGKQVELEQGSVLRVRIDSPFQIQLR